jgi:hypothetical protein
MKGGGREKEGKREKKREGEGASEERKKGRKEMKTKKIKN